jgi:spore germination cell wall hydrolase CwlJ-like protein
MELSETTLRVFVSRALGWALILFALSMGIRQTPTNIYVPLAPAPLRTGMGVPQVLQGAVPSALPAPTKKVAVQTPRQLSEELCLAQAMYFESGFEPRDGIEAVAAVVLNRVRSGVYPSTVCGVVYQPAQFSWTVDMGKWAQIPPRKFRELAKTFLRTPDILVNAHWRVTHFHHEDMMPAWASQLHYVGTYGHHRFYSF